MTTKRSFRKNRSTRKHSGGVKKSHLLMGALGLGSLAGASAAPAQGPSILGSGQRWSNGPGRSANNYKNTAQMTMRNRNYQRYDPIVNYQGPGLRTMRSNIQKMNRMQPMGSIPNMGQNFKPMELQKIQHMNRMQQMGPIRSMGQNLKPMELQKIQHMNRMQQMGPMRDMEQNLKPIEFQRDGPLVNYKGPGLSTMRNNIKKMNRVHEVVPINMGQNVKPNQKPWQMNVNPDWSAIGKMNRVRNVGALPNMGKYYVPAENMGSFQENWKVPVWNVGRTRDLERNFKFDVKPNFNPA